MLYKRIEGYPLEFSTGDIATEVPESLTIGLSEVDTVIKTNSTSHRESHSSTSDSKFIWPDEIRGIEWNPLPIRNIGEDSIIGPDITTIHILAGTETGLFDKIKPIGLIEKIDTSHKVAGLYAAFFNRAPDADGLDYWEEYVDIQGLPIDDIAALFVTHPIFRETYDGLENQNFVEAVYLNMLGGEGDQGGINYWVDMLNAGMARSKMVSDFVQGSLTIDLESMLDDGLLNQQEYEDAVVRKNIIKYKSLTGVEFAEQMGELSNVTSEGLDLLEDPAYLASIAVLSGINDDRERYFEIMRLIDESTYREDSLDYLIEQSTQDSIIEQPDISSTLIL